MSLFLVALVLGFHLVFDFILQTPYQAENKSKSFGALLSHTIQYSIWGMILSCFYPQLGFSFFWYLLVTHTLIDGFTSRVTARLWQQKRVHDFFVVIGFDQFLHYITIFSYLSMVGIK